MNTERKKLAVYWMQKAKRSYETAVRELKQKNYDFCANRLYYAAFYAVSAVLILRGQSYTKHSGVRAALHRDFVKTGIIATEFGALYDALLRDREESDYVAFADLDPEVLKQEIIEVKKFVDKFHGILASEIDKD